MRPKPIARRGRTPPGTKVRLPPIPPKLVARPDHPARGTLTSSPPATSGRPRRTFQLRGTHQRTAECRSLDKHDPVHAAARSARAKDWLRQSVRAERVDATIFLRAIIDAADRLRAARTFDGSPAFRFDRGWSMLQAIERSGGCLTFSDIAKALGVRKQSIRAHVLAAERAGEVEVAPDPRDRRAFNVELTPRGRRTVENERMPEISWMLAQWPRADSHAIDHSCATGHSPTAGPVREGRAACRQGAILTPQAQPRYRRPASCAGVSPASARRSRAR